MEDIAARRRGKIRRLLARRDGDANDDQPDALASAEAEAEAVAVQLPMGLDEPAPRTSASRRRWAFIDGFSLHADTSVDAATDPRSSGSSARGRVPEWPWP